MTVNITSAFSPASMVVADESASMSCAAVTSIISGVALVGAIAIRRLKNYFNPKTVPLTDSLPSKILLVDFIVDQFEAGNRLIERVVPEYLRADALKNPTIKNDCLVLISELFPNEVKDVGYRGFTVDVQPQLSLDAYRINPKKFLRKYISFAKQKSGRKSVDAAQLTEDRPLLKDLRIREIFDFLRR